MSILLRGPVLGMGAESAILIHDGYIRWIGTGRPPEGADTKLVAEAGETIAPGFIDLQVNGYGGNDASAGRDAISAISDLLPKTGVTSFLPTAISRPMTQAREFVEAARAAKAPGARILGAHLEGPFLSPSFCGAHDPAVLLEPTPDRLEKILTSPPRMMTLAPELPGALEAIARLRAAGVVVAAGHSGADFDLGVRAIDRGLRFGTHLYNAMGAFHHRRPGLIGALLMDRRVTVGLISDGLHLHPATVEQTLRLKTPSRVALTTDQTAAAGVPAGRYRVGGRDVVSDGQAVRLEDGALAGSAATMDELVRRTAQLGGMTPGRAVTMASATPARVLGAGDLGRLRTGARADLVILTRDLRVRLTMVAGRVVFQG